MAPFVPEPLSENLSLLLAFFIGIAFGWVLEQAGFSSPRRLAGVFYGYDFTVLRVFFTAGVTAMVGVILLGSFGLLDLEAIYVNPLWLKPAILGGVIMGAGFILGGYCPGTSVCALAIGKVDALFFVLGGLLGALLFAEGYPMFKTLYESTALGPVKVFESLHVSQGLFAFGMILMAVGAFVFTTRVERKVAGAHAPSVAFPVRVHQAAGASLALLGLVLVFLPDYRTRVLNTVSKPSYQASHPLKAMSPDELAFRILDKDLKLRIVDLRTRGEFAALALPGSRNLALKELFGKEAAFVAPRSITKVIVANSEAEARTGALVLARLGFENLQVLEGGWPAFDHRFLHPEPFQGQGGRWDADLKAFREDAQARLPKLILESRAVKGEAKPEKKIQGGC